MQDNWLVALTVARDAAIISRSAHKLTLKELSVDEMIVHANMFIKQGVLFESVRTDDRKLTLTKESLNTADTLKIGQFLYYESIAAGTAEYYHHLLQEVLLIHPSDRGRWTSLLQGWFLSFELNPCLM